MALAAAEGAGEIGRLIPAAEVTERDLLDASGYFFICPENLASMSGEMKEMFDRTYYAVLNKIEGRPFATAIAAGSDGEGAQRQIDRIARGWRLRRVADHLIVITGAQSAAEIAAPKILPAAQLSQSRDLGHSLAEGLRLGIF